MRGDSQLIIDQVMKDSNCHDPKMEAYCKLVRRLEDKFDGLELNHIAWKFNEAADELAKMASAWAPVPPNVFARDLHKPSIDYASATEKGPPQGPRPPLSPRPLRPSLRSWKSMQSLPRLTRVRTSESRSLIASFEESFL